MRGGRATGFTLVELLVVIIILAVIAAIAIPKFTYCKQEAFESTTKAQLFILRDALSRFNSDTGMWPASLDDMASATAPAQALNNGGQPKALDASTYRGPYVSAPTIPNDLSGWVQYTFSPSTKGVITCPHSGNALDGTPYSSW